MVFSEPALKAEGFTGDVLAMPASNMAANAENNALSILFVVFVCYKDVNQFIRL